MRVNTLFLKSRRFKKAFHYIDHSGSFHFLQKEILINTLCVQALQHAVLSRYVRSQTRYCSQHSKSD